MPFTDPYVANPYPYAFAATLSSTTNPGAPYEIVENFVSGVYTISWSGGGTLNVDFYNGTTFIGTAAGTSSITYNLAQSATKAVLWNTVAGVSVVLSLTALAVAPVSGVLTTYAASGTPGLVGDAYVLLIGGGGGGGWCWVNGTNTPNPGGGGGSGGITGGRATLTGSEVLTIGSGGTFGTNVVAATAGNQTTFAGFTAGGGGPGGNGSSSGLGSGGTAGNPNGGAGGAGVAGATPNVGSACSNSSAFFNFFQQGTTGGGGGGNIYSAGYLGGAGGGLGIGTGGHGGSATSGAPTNPTGYGAGGGAGGATSISVGQNGTAGSGGVCYVVLVA